MTSSVAPVQQAMELFFKCEVQIIGPIVSECYHLQEKQIWMSLPKLCSLENITFISCDQKMPLFTLGTRKVPTPPSYHQKRTPFTLGTRKVSAPPSCDQKNRSSPLGPEKCLLRPLVTKKGRSPPLGPEKCPLHPLVTKKIPLLSLRPEKSPFLTVGTIKSVRPSPLGPHKVSAPHPWDHRKCPLLTLGTIKKGPLLTLGTKKRVRLSRLGP